MSERPGNRLPLALVVLTLNEERHLPECLGSAAGLAERTLIVDSGSDDMTVEIAQQIGVDVVYNEFRGYASQRNAALQMVTQEWTLFLDADERMTPAFRAELAETIRTAPPEIAGYNVARRNFMFGHEIRGGGWWPDHQLRLLRRGHAHYTTDHEVHEVVEVDGDVRTLSEPILHLNYDSMEEFRTKQLHYGQMRARELATQRRAPRSRGFIGRPVREFWRRYVTLAGYRDGWIGIRLALAMAWYEILVLSQTRTLMEERARTSRAHDDIEAYYQQHPARLASPEIDLSIIIVSFNVRELLLACLASIEAWLAIAKQRVEVIVIDNASSDASVDSVRRRFPGAKLIELQQNIGFAAANNRAVKDASGRFVVFLNPDTTVVGDAFGLLLNYIEKQEDVGVVGPRLIYPDGTTQSTRRRFPTRRTGFLESTIVQQYWRDNRVLRRYYVADRSNDEIQDVDWLVGACLLARRETLDMAGLFDERFFMYAEEVEWCHRVRESGWRIVYLPSASIVHHEGGSSRSDLPVRQINFDTSKVLLYERLHGKSTARVLRTFLLGSYLINAGIEAGKGVLGHKRSLRAERVKLYLGAFKSGLRGRSETD
ncbi:MAG TPA: glycosyltransferase [Nitrolancea sp.]|nr:glycosyltransferase [Nitrolancea sp.]